MSGVTHGKGCQQVDEDAVVVAGVQGNVFAACVGHGPDDVQRAIAVEWSDLDCPHAFDLGEGAPEGVAERPSSHAGLEIEAEQRQYLRNLATVMNQLRFI